MNREELHIYEPFWNNWYLCEDALLGAGSFGAVYKIKREEFGNVQYAALKVITVPSSQSEIAQLEEMGMSGEEMQEYFLGIVKDIYSEVKLLSDLKGNSHIVCYEDHEIMENRNGLGYHIFIRMELAESLASYGNKHALTETDIVKLGKDLCQALIACEKQNVLHRDIKPGNIFVSRNGDYKLGDFGIARTIEEHQFGLSVKGSYSYMAPEVYYSGNDGGNYDQKADQYSLGVVLYTYLNQKRIPFLSGKLKTVTHSEQQEALRKRLSGEKPELPENVSRELATIVLKAMAYRPEHRYKNAEEFYRALEGFEKNRKDEETVMREYERTVALTVSTQVRKELLEKENFVQPEETASISIGETQEVQKKNEESVKKSKSKKIPYIIAAASVLSAITLVGVETATIRQQQPVALVGKVADDVMVDSALLTSVEKENKKYFSKAYIKKKLCTPTPKPTKVPHKKPKVEKTVVQTPVATQVVNITPTPTNTPKPTQAPAEVRSISVPSAMQLAKGGTVSLYVNIEPSGASYTLQSSDSSIVSVSGTRLYGKKSGNCTITVKAGGKSAKCSVNVTEQ